MCSPFVMCLMGLSFSAYENEDQLLWRPDVVLESKVKEYLVETSLRTGNEKVIDRISSGTHTRDNEQVCFLPLFWNSRLLCSYKCLISFNVNWISFFSGFFVCIGCKGCEWRTAVDSGVFLGCFLRYFLRQDLSKNNVGTWFLLQDSVHLFRSGIVSFIRN